MKRERERERERERRGGGGEEMSCYSEKTPKCLPIKDIVNVRNTVCAESQSTHKHYRVCYAIQSVS